MNENEFPNDGGFYDLTQPFRVLKNVIVFDGKKPILFENVEFVQRSFTYCYYDSVCRRFRFELKDVGNVCHVFGNPCSFLTEEGFHFELCVIFDCGVSDDEIRRLKSFLIGEYLGKVYKEADRILGRMAEICDMVNENMNDELSKEFDSIFRVGDKVCCVLDSSKYNAKMLKAFAGNVGEIVEIRECDDYDCENKIGDVPSRFLVKFGKKIAGSFEKWMEAHELRLV